MCDMQKMPSREDASCEEDSDMNFATFSAVGAPGTHFVTTGGQLPVTKIQQNVSNNGTGMQQVCVAMGDGGVQYMRALDAGASLQAAPQLISVPIALPGAKPGDPQPTVQIQVLNPNLLQAQQQPKYQMQIPIQGFQQGGAVLTLAYSPENEAGGIQLVGQGNLGEGLQVLATLPHEMQLVQPTQDKDHMQNMHQVFITPNQQIIINGPENKTLNNNTSSDNNNAAMDIIIKEECDETTNDDESSQGTETSDSVQWQLGTSHQQDLVKYLNTLPPQQTQALPASLQQFLRKNPTDVKSEPVEIDIDMDDVVTDDKKEEPVAEAVLSEGLYLESSSEQQRSELDLQDYVKILNEESNDTFETLKDNFPKMKSPAYNTDYFVKKDVSIPRYFGMQSKKSSQAEPSYKAIDQSITKVGPVTNQRSKQLTEVFPVPKRTRNNKRKNLKSVSQTVPVTSPYETIDLVTDDYPEPMPKTLKSQQTVVSVKNIKNKAEEPTINTNQHSVEPVIQFLPVFKKPPLKVLPVLINAPVNTVSHESQISTPRQYIAYKPVKPLAQVRPMMKESYNPTENTSVKNKTVESPTKSPPEPKKSRVQTKNNIVDNVSCKSPKPLKIDTLTITDKTFKPDKVSPLTYESNNLFKTSPEAALPVTSKLNEPSKYNLISYPSNHIIEPPKVSPLTSKLKKQTRNKSVKYLPYKTIKTFPDSLPSDKNSFEQTDFNIKTLPSFKITEPLSKILPLATNTSSNPTKDNSVIYVSTNPTKHSSNSETVTSTSYKQTEFNPDHYKSFQKIEPVQDDSSSVPTDGFSTECTKVSSGTYPSYEITESLPDKLSATNDLFQKAKVNSDEYSLDTIEPLPLSETFPVTNGTFDQTENNIETISSYQSIRPQSDAFRVTNNALQPPNVSSESLTLSDNFPVTKDALEPTQGITETYPLFQTLEPLSETFSVRNNSLDQTAVNSASFQQYEIIEPPPESVSVTNDSIVQNEINNKTYPSYQTGKFLPEVVSGTNKSYETSENNSVTYQSYENVELVQEVQTLANDTYRSNVIESQSYLSREPIEPLAEVLPATDESSIDPSAYNPENYQTFQIIEPSADDAITNETYKFTEIPPEMYESYEEMGQEPEVANESYNPSDNNTNDPSTYQLYKIDGPPKLNESIDAVEAPPVTYQSYTNSEQTEGLSVINTSYGAPDGPSMACLSYQNHESSPEAIPSTNIFHSPTATNPSFQITEPATEIEEPLVEDQQVNYTTYGNCEPQTEALSGNYAPYGTIDSFTHDVKSYQTVESAEAVQPGLYPSHESVGSVTRVQSITNKFYQTTKQITDMNPDGYQSYKTVELIEQQPAKYQPYEIVQKLTGLKTTKSQPYDTGQQKSGLRSNTNRPCETDEHIIREQPPATFQTFEKVQSLPEFQSITNQHHGTVPQLIAQPLATNQLYDTVEQLEEQYETVQVVSEESGPNSQHGTVPQPLATNQLYDTVEQLEEQYETVQDISEESSPKSQYGTVPQPLATNQLYDTVEQLEEQYETVQDISEQSGPNSQNATVPQPLATNKLYNTVEQIEEQYEFVQGISEESDPNSQHVTVPQPLATNQLYDTVEQLEEQYETVQGISEESGPNSQHGTVPQPLATNQLYDTVEQLEEQYETVQVVSEESGPNSQHGTIPQPLATNQLYDTVEQLEEQYETVQSIPEESGPNSQNGTVPQPLATNQLYDTVEQLEKQYETVQGILEESGPNTQHGTVPQPLATNQLYDTVEQLEEQYETVQGILEESGPNLQHGTVPQPLATNQLYDTVELEEQYETVQVVSEESGPNSQHGTVQQLIEQPLATNQLYDTVEQLEEQYETVQGISEESGPNSQHGTVPQPLATNQLYDTVEQLEEQYETVQVVSEESGPNSQHGTIPQPLATNQLYDTVEQLEEQYETVQGILEESGPNSQHGTIPQPLATNQLYDTVEQLEEQYETVQGILEESGPNSQHGTIPQPLATNQLYDTVEQLEEQYETVQVVSEESGPNSQHGTIPQPLATNQLYDTVEQLEEQYETVQVVSEESGPNSQHGTIPQPLATNQLYDTVEQLEEQYETVQVVSEESGPNSQHGTIPQPLATNQLYHTVEQLEEQYETVQGILEESGPNSQHGTIPQPLATNQLYDTVEQLEEQYETVQSIPEESGPNSQHGTVPQPLATNQLYDTVEQLEEQYETVQDISEESGPNSQHGTVPQPLATNQLYDTVEQLEEQYETVQGISEESGPNSQHGTVSQPLATTQLYDTAEQLEEQYETVQGLSEESGPNSQHGAIPQHLATNQLYETVEQISQKYQRYENDQHFTEQPLSTNHVYESAQQLTELQPATNQQYEAFIQQITEQLATNQQYESFQRLTELQSDANQLYKTIEQQPKLEPASYPPYEMLEPSFQTSYKTADSFFDSPTLPLADLIPLTYPSYESIEPLKPLTKVSPGTYTSQEVVEPKTEIPETSSYQSFGPLTEVFTVHYPQYENIEPLSELYPLYDTTGSLTQALSLTNGTYGAYPSLNDVNLPSEYYENIDDIKPFIGTQSTAYPSYGAVEYFTEIPPPSYYSSNEFLEPKIEPSETNSSFEAAAPWTNYLPSESMDTNYLNGNYYPIYQNNGTEGESSPNATIAYGAVDSSTIPPFETDEFVSKVENITKTSSDTVESLTEFPFVANTAYNTPSLQSELPPPYQTLDTQTNVFPVPTIESQNTNLLVSSPDQQPTQVYVVSYKLPEPKSEIFLDVDNKSQNANKHYRIPKTTERKTKSKKAKAVELNSERKVNKPKKIRATKKSNTESVDPNIKCETIKTEPKVEKAPYYDIIKAKPFSPTIKIYNKDKDLKSEYDIQRLKSVRETLKSEAEIASKKKSDIVVLRSEQGTFIPLSEEERVQNADKKRQRIGEKYTRLKKSIQRVTGLSYRNSRGVIVPDKSSKIGTCSCPLKCATKINETQQQKVFNEFHTLTTFKKQEEYIFSLIKVFRKSNAFKSNTSKRKHTLRYHIIGSNGKEVIVCKMFFKKTLVISDGRISRVLKRRPLDTEELPFEFEYDEKDEELN